MPTEKHLAMPEWLSRQDTAPESWTVVEGAPVRGEAWTNFGIHEMKVPVGATELERVIRAHEMTHAKVSPLELTNEQIESLEVAPDIREASDLLRMAEEFRVNMLCQEAGFDMKGTLSDGSEKLTGETMAKNNDWNSAVGFLGAVAGTKAGAEFLKGVRKHSPDMAKLLREVEKTMMKEWRKDMRTKGTEKLASTKIHRRSGIPRGFHYNTTKYAKMLKSAMIDEAGEGPGESGESEEMTPQDVRDKMNPRNAQREFWGTLIEKKVPKPRSVDGRLGRKRVPADIGRNPRRLNRMLTDPDKRIFDKRVRAKGGIVLIDQSGSMHLDDDDIWAIIKQAPACTIIGYSHRSGSTGHPNIWVMADRGKVCDTIPSGNGGNGVDGPAIRFALNYRRKGEPFIWVCDGIVTGHNDAVDRRLSEECVKLVKANGIHNVHTVGEAITALRKARQGEKIGTLVSPTLESYLAGF